MVSSRQQGEPMRQWQDLSVLAEHFKNLTYFYASKLNVYTVCFLVLLCFFFSFYPFLPSSFPSSFVPFLIPSFCSTFAFG